MSMRDEPDDSARNDAELRAFLRMAGALERGDIDELAAALLEDSGRERPAPGNQERRQEK